MPEGETADWCENSLNLDECHVRLIASPQRRILSATTPDRIHHCSIATGCFFTYVDFVSRTVDYKFFKFWDPTRTITSQTIT
jgi:hypothetical protein